MNKHQFMGRVVALWEAWTQQARTEEQREWDEWVDELYDLLDAHLEDFDDRDKDTDD